MLSCEVIMKIITVSFINNSANESDKDVNKIRFLLTILYQNMYI